jgi:hypothetical protein
MMHGDVTFTTELSEMVSGIAGKFAKNGLISGVCPSGRKSGIGSNGSVSNTFTS